MVNRLTGELSVFCDGGARGNPGLAACAFVVEDMMRRVIYRQGKFLGRATNNVAEYSGVILAWSWLVENEGPDRVNFFLDSQLVVNQLNGLYRVKDEKMIKLVLLIKQQQEKFRGIAVYTHIARDKNKRADRLVNKILDQHAFAEKIM